MRILVTAKETAIVEDEFVISDNQIDDSYLSYDLNEWDDYAIEEAVQIKENADDDVEVVAVSIGPERSDETIRQALAKGADRAIRVWDEVLADVDLLDVETKASILAAVANQEDPDLILTGVQSGDDLWGATGVSLARELGFQWAAVVNQLDLDPESEKAHVHRELEGGIEELTDVDLPAVLTIQSGINDPRYASLRGIRSAQSKPLDVQSLNDIGLNDDVGGVLTLQGISEPESDSDAVLLDGDPDDQAVQLADLLNDEGVVEV